MTHEFSPRAIALLCLLTVLAGCDADADADPEDAGPDATTPDAGSDAGLDAGSDADALDDASLDAGLDDPLYGVCLLQFTPGGATGFATTAPDLDSGEIDTASAIELGGNHVCAASRNALFAGDQTSPVLTRYDVQDDGSLVEGDRISFAGEGLTAFTGFSRSFALLSDTEGLFINRQDGLAVRFNPTAMTVDGSFEIRGYETEGQTAFLRRAIAPSRDELVFYVRYSGMDGLFTDESALVLVDPDTEEVTVARDDRCGALNSEVETSDGTLYFASATDPSHYGPLGIGTPGQDTCILRLLPGQTRFDPDYLVRPRDLTGARSGLIIPAGPDGALIYAFDDSLVDSSGFTTAREFDNATAWRVYRIDDLAAPTMATTTVLDSFEPTISGVAETLTFGDRTYLPVLAPDFASATLSNITDPEAPFDGLSVSGALFYSVVQIR